MLLPGRLAGTTLGDLFGLLHRERATGVLELVERGGPTAGRRHAIHFDAGLISEVETAFGVARLGDILKAQGFIGDDTLRRLSQRLLSRPGQKSGELLIADASISPSVVGAALRRQLRLRVDALFRLADAELRFRVARASSAPRRLPLSPREFLHGRPRARDRDAERAEQRRGPGRDRARARAFELLGVDPSSDRAEVVRAFRKLARAFHPDRHPRASAPERAELLRRFSEISAAYHLLVA